VPNPWSLRPTGTLYAFRGGGDIVQTAYTAPAAPTAVGVAANYLLSPGPSGGMADAADSKSAEGNLVRVRLSPRAFRQ
jgi:hypothetical protein